MTVRIRVIVEDDADATTETITVEAMALTPAVYTVLSRLAQMVRPDLEAVIGETTRLVAFAQVILDAVGDGSPGVTSTSSESRFVDPRAN